MAERVTYSNINELVNHGDYDAILSYLSLVNGIDGAILYDRDGLVMALGENTSGHLLLESPYLLANYLDSMVRLDGTEFGRLDSQVSFGTENFYQIVNLNRTSLFFLVVSGPKGSYELFKIRIGRAAQALERLLYEKGYKG